MEYEWVIGLYDGEQARHVQGLADSGICYFKIDFIETASGKKAAVAFRRATDSPRPDHLSEVKDPYKIANFEKMAMRRLGVSS